MVSTPNPSLNSASDDDLVVGLPIIEWANIVLRHARLIGLMMVVAAGATFAYSVLAPRGYTASVVFMPAAQGSGGDRLGGLAAQLGINTSGQASSESPGFYETLLKTRTFLERAASMPYVGDTVAGTPQVVSLAEAYALPPGPRNERIRAAASELSKSINVDSDRATGVMTLNVSAPNANVATQLATRLVELLNDYNNNRRRSQASAQREFVQTQLREAQEDLAEAEVALESFQERNRVYSSSPSLMLELGRLQRRIELRQQVYVSLAQALEQAKIDEVRTTPVLTLLDPPVASAAVIGRGPIMNSVLAAVVALFLCVIIAFIVEGLRRHAHTEPVALSEFRHQVDRLVPSSVRRIFRRRAAA